MKLETKKLDNLRKKHNLSLILLHGSQATGRVHAKSDIDIAVLSEKDIKIDQLELIGDLSEIFNLEKLDITDLSRADPLLLYAVMEKSKLLSGSEKLYKNLKLKAFKRYIDYQPYLKIEYDLVVRNLSKFL